MAFRDIDINLAAETRAMVEHVKRFSMEVMRPAGIELDKLPKPEDVIARDSILWDVFKGFRELGLHTLEIPKNLGGLAEDIDPLAKVLISEQLGYADTGLTVSMGVASMPFNYAARFP